MKQLEYQLRFLTPAFLGDAEQNARWRTPPIKHLLREWWRVVWAADNSFPNGDSALKRMRHEEGLLFGHAWLDDDQDRRGQKVAARKSQVRLRLDSWGSGKLKSWQGLEQDKVQHREVERTGYKVGPLAYLGYGPLDGRGNTKLSEKANAAIQANESATFAIAFPTTHKRPELKELIEANAPRIERALWLMNRYGTLGGRSRNGWGSFVFTPLLPAEESQESKALPLRSWRDCLDRDWPHAIGVDDQGPLAWQTEAFDDWKPAMRRLAELKIGLRTQFKFPDVKPPHPQPLDRHWLSYPITRHSTSAWDRNARLPNSLRFKICPSVSEPRQVVGVIFHVPCLPPAAFNPNRTEIERVWQQVHAFLNAPTQKLTRIPA